MRTDHCRRYTNAVSAAAAAENVQLDGYAAQGLRSGLDVYDPNLLDRNFTPFAPNQVWTSDITNGVAPVETGSEADASLEAG